MMTECSEKDGIIRITPFNTKDKFPEFNEIEQRANGDVIGWSGALLKNITPTFLTREKRKVEVVSIGMEEVVLKVGRNI